MDASMMDRTWKMKSIYRFLFNPFSLPVIGFGTAILFGALLLHLPISCKAEPVSFMNALFTATSATCVTGIGDTVSFEKLKP